MHEAMEEQNHYIDQANKLRMSMGYDNKIRLRGTRVSHVSQIHPSNFKNSILDQTKTFQSHLSPASLQSNSVGKSQEILQKVHSDSYGSTHVFKGSCDVAIAISTDEVRSKGS